MNHIKHFDIFEAELLEEKFFIENNILFKETFSIYLEYSTLESNVKLEISNFNLNESFWEKFSGRFDKASNVSKTISDKAKVELQKIIERTKNAISFAKKIGESIQVFFKLILEKGKAALIVNKQLNEKLNELTKTKKEGLVKDVKTIREVLSFYKEKFIGNLLSNIETNLSSMFAKNQEEISESLLESNVIGTFVHKIEEVFPFSWLHKIAQAGEAGAAALIKELSNFTHKLGGPKFELPVIVLIAGIFLEQVIKTQVSHWLLDITSSITPFGLAIKGIKITALFLSLLIAIDAITGEKLLGHSAHH